MTLLAVMSVLQHFVNSQEPGEVSEGRRALQKHLQDIKAWQQGGPSSKVPAVAAQPTSRSAGPSSTRQHALQGKVAAVSPPAVTSKLVDQGDLALKPSKLGAYISAMQDSNAAFFVHTTAPQYKAVSIILCIPSFQYEAISSNPRVG